LLIERFDREQTKKGWERKSMLSALTLFELDEMRAIYASYENLAEIIRYRFKDAIGALKELFQRMTFNILVGNTDDHARNHAAFWDGHMLALTPAYDICPQNRSENIATQAMLIIKDNNKSQIASCLDAAPNFLLTRKEALQFIENQIKAIVDNWNSICKLSKIHLVDKKLLASRQFLNLHAFENLTKNELHLIDPVLTFKAKI